ncbi:DUF6385 domain-containing protein, partial [Clostridium senegalense]|uniref:DUF6385 domain-containing protein n=1 Tax=Clostridium senegalense TaxID=1465809 RepID=UPI000289732C
GTVTVSGYYTTYTTSNITGTGTGVVLTETVNSLAEYAYYIENGATNTAYIGIQLAPTVGGVYVTDSIAGTVTVGPSGSAIVVPSKYANNARLSYSGTDLSVTVSFVGRA